MIPVALSFPNLHAKKLMMVLFLMLVFSSVSLAAWGITGADPLTILKYAFTGQPTFKTVVKYSDEGEVLKDKVVYSLGDPEILEDCIARSLEHCEKDLNSHGMLQGGTWTHIVECAKE